MEPWIAEALSRLTKLEAEAQAETATAHIEETLATARYEDARARWSHLNKLLRDFREFAEAQPEGGAE